LVKNADGSYTFTRTRSRISYGFSAAGEVTSESDLNGYVTKLAYNSSGQLTSVTDPAGRKLMFTYSGSHVASAADPQGRICKYAYDSSGNLVKVTDPLGRAWSFTYDTGHRLLTMTGPRGGKWSNTYNSSGQVTAQVDPDGGKSTWSYSGNAATLAGGSTTLTDPAGNKTTYQYSGLEMLSVTSGVGTSAAATTSYTYDPVSLGIISETDPDGNTTTSTYDASGNLLTRTDPLGGVTTYTYNALNEVLTSADPLGNTAAYSYDAAGNPLSVTDPLGHGTTYQYDDAAHPGDITSVTDPDGHVASYAYDKYGNLASSSVAPSPSVTNTTAYAYDADGERYCAVSPKQVAAGVTCAALGAAAKAGTTVTVYDGDGERTSVTDPDGHVTRYAYDASGDPSSMTNAAGDVTSYAYNGDGEQVAVTQPDKSALATAYDLDGNVIRQVNAAGKATTYAYNALGLVTSATDPLGHVTRYGYDKAGNRVTLTDASGRVTTYAYDKDGRLTGITYSDGKTPAVTYAYNAAGWRTSMTDGTGTTTYEYDADGRTTSVSSGTGGTVSYGLDPGGLLTMITYPNGQVVTRGYDGAGELISVSDWLGNTTTFGYDRDGTVSSEAYPNGVSAVSAYDKAGRLVSITDKHGSATVAGFAYGHNSLGEVTSDTETGALQGTQSYSYTQLSQLASSSAGKYGYDAVGDLTAQPGGETQVFNADGQLTTTSVPGQVKAGPSVAASVSGSQLSKGSSVTSAALTTKAAGDLIVAFVSAAGPSGKTQRVTGVTGGGLSWRLVTRADGEQGTAEVWQAYATKALSRVKVTAAINDKGYDAAITVTAFSGARSAVGAHATGSRASGTPAVSLKTSGTDSAVWSAGEDPSAAKSRTAISGQSVVHQVLDTGRKATFWAQRSGTIAKSGTTVKAGDTSPAGDKWNLAAVEILAAIPSVKTSYAYDKAGDLVTAGSATLGYNQASELTSYGTSATYAYNGDGLRVAKTVNGVTTVFAWDTSGSVPLVIAAGSTYYLYGPGEQPIEQVTGTTPAYLLDDQSGSTRLITDAAGAVTGTYAYGGYGTVARHTGTATTALQYDGQYTDAESGYQYLQARYYNPATGQFLTQDPLVSVTGQPYGFAGGDPLNAADPTGLQAVAATPTAVEACLAAPAVCALVVGGTLLGAGGLALWNHHAQQTTTGDAAASRAATQTERPSCKAAGQGYTRVGRWMSEDEFEQMTATNRVIEGGGGRTYVISPPNPASYQGAPPGSVFATFDVPTSSLRQGGQWDWYFIPGPNIGTSIFGTPPGQMPPAMCIVRVCSK
jgi:RHS repeat-associated protein